MEVGKRAWAAGSVAGPGEGVECEAFVGSPSTAGSRGVGIDGKKGRKSSRIAVQKRWRVPAGSSGGA